MYNFIMANMELSSIAFIQKLWQINEIKSLRHSFKLYNPKIYLPSMLIKFKYACHFSDYPWPPSIKKERVIVIISVCFSTRTSQKLDMRLCHIFTLGGVYTWLGPAQTSSRLRLPNVLMNFRQDLIHVNSHCSYSPVHCLFF